MKLLSFILPFGRSRLVRSGNPPRIVIRVSGCAAVGLLCWLSAFRAWSADCVSPPAGLVGWWQGEGNAADIADANNGTLHNGVGFASGKVGQVFVFNGTSSYVEVPDSPSLRLTNELTIEFWVKRQDLNATDTIINKGGDYTGGAANYGVGIPPVQSGTGPTVGFIFGGGTRHSTSIADLNSHHIAVAARNGDADPIFYVDGVQQPITLRQGPSTISLYPSTKPLYIGAQVDPVTGWYYYSKAIVDELSIYSRALSAAEVQAIYNAGSAGKCITVPVITSQPRSQVGYWGKSITLTVTAAGAIPLSYQWLKGNAPIEGASGSSLVLTNLQMTDAGNYSVVVTNAYGITTSDNANLTMNPAGVSLALYSGITIDGVVGLTYGIQYNTDLSNTNGWHGMANVTLGVPTQLWFDVQPANQPQRYYRVVPGPISVP
jgi:hypothetical protein